MKLFSKIATALVGMAMAIGVGVAVSGINAKAVNEVNAADGDTHVISDFTGKDAAVLLNNGATPDTISLGDQGYYVKQVIIGWQHNKSNNGVTASVSVGGNSLGTGKVGGQNTTTTTTIGDGNTSLSGAIEITWTNGMSGTGKGTLYLRSLTLVEGSGAPLITYTITYDANGGTGTMSDTTNTVAACTFTAPEGKTFSTWNTNASGTGTDYAPGASATSDLDLFAIWVDLPDGVVIDKDTLTMTNPSASSGYAKYDGTRDIGGVDIFTSDVMINESKVQAKKTTGWLKNSTTLGVIKTITLSSDSENFSIYASSSEITTRGDGTPVTSGADISASEYQYFAVISGSSAAKVSSITVEFVTETGKTMRIQNNTHQVGPFEVTYGDTSSYKNALAWDVDGNTAINSGCTWVVSDESIIDYFVDGYTWLQYKPKNVGTTTITVSHDDFKTVSTTITVTPGTLEQISVSGTMTKTTYAESEAWSATGLTVTATYDSGAVVDVTSQVTWTWNPEAPLEGVTSVVATATYSGETASSTAQNVTVTPVASTPLSSFYDGTITLKTSRGALTNDDWYTIKGVVVGINGKQYYIQDGQYGILVYNEDSYHYTYYDGIALGDYVRLHTRVYSYYNCVETNSRDSEQTVVKLGTQALPDAVEYTSVSSFMAGRQSIRASLSNVAVDASNIETISGFSGTSTSDQKFTVYDINSTSDTTTILIHKSVNETNKTAIVNKLKTITVDDTVEFVRTVVSYYNGNQISLASADQIIVHTPAEDKLAAWGVNYLFIGDPAFDGDGTGLCKSANLYKDAKTALFVLESEESGSITKLQEDGTYAAELARYLAWAKACGDNAPFINDFGFLSSASNTTVTSNNLNNSLSVIVVAVIAITSVSAIGVLLVIKRRKSI